MISVVDVETMILEMPTAYKDYPFGEQPAVYFVDLRPKSSDLSESQEANLTSGDSGRKMFALVDEKSLPVRISLKCDPQLATLLREKYESVLPGYHLNKKHWNTIICSGQLEDQELQDLIRHSYELVMAAS